MKSIINVIFNNVCMQSSCASFEVPGIFSCCSIMLANLTTLRMCHISRASQYG